MRPGPNLVVAGAATLTVAFALATTAIALGTTRPLPDADDARGTVARYVSAVLQGMPDEAAALLDPDLGCSADDLREPEYLYGDATAFEVGPQRGGRVEVSMTHLDSGLSQYTIQEPFHLHERDGRWLIEQNPWPIYQSCR